jgi:SAM-dependent methyltransferase
MIKSHFSQFLRQLGLIYKTDRIWFYVERLKNSKINRTFKKQHPDIQLPPDYLIYESFQINYYKYYTESLNTAQWLCNYFTKYLRLENKKILDWGCGPGRLIRHLPKTIGNGCEYYGTDYNAKSVAWCKMNLQGIHFNTNSLNPVLPYPDNFFDIIYGISVFTHLSEKLHFEWFHELSRILKPQGILFLTTQGDNYRAKLTQAELLVYNGGKLVIRGHVKEGHRTFSAFHPKEFMRTMFRKVEILEHVETKPLKGGWLPQDVWILKKP